MAKKSGDPFKKRVWCEEHVWEQKYCTMCPPEKRVQKARRKKAKGQ